MKLVLIYIVALLAVAAAAVLIGARPTEARWGAAGVTSMRAAVGMCLLAALIAAVPIAIATGKRSSYAPQACLGGTVLRLLITMGLAVAYQSTTQVHMRSFLSWLVIAYLLFLTVETALTVWVVRRRWSPAGGEK